MRKKIIYTKGQKINGLTYLKEMPKKNNRRALFQCRCGKEFITTVGAICSGNTTSCGCFRRERLKTHGLRKHPLYTVWINIKGRCLNINDKAYKYYGGRGIKVCNEWRENFQKFYNWAIANGYQKHLTIERIDNNGNYTSENCTFATMVDQSHNTRTTKLDWEKVNKIREMKGTMFQREIADIYEVRQQTICSILKNKAWKV